MSHPAGKTRKAASPATGQMGRPVFGGVTLLVAVLLVVPASAASAAHAACDPRVSATVDAGCEFLIDDSQAVVAWPSLDIDGTPLCGSVRSSGPARRSRTVLHVLLLDLPPPAV